MSTTHSISEANTNQPRSPWIYGPWLDLIVGCGAWSAPLLLFAFFVGQDSPRGWTLSFYLLALLFNYPHFMATVYRAYHTQSEFAKYRIFTVHAALLLAIAGILVHTWYGLLPWLFTIYICWSPWHYTGQNFGLLMMFSRRSGISPEKPERRAVWLAFVASFILLMLSFHTGPSGDGLILSLNLPATFTVPARVALAIFFFVSITWAFARMSRRGGWRMLLAPVILALTQFLWFLLPAIIELASGHGIPQTRYSSGILAVLHSTQYLWITSYYQEKESRAAGTASWSLAKYLLILIAGGIALFIPGPWIVSRLFHVDFAASFLAFTALVNIHHFLLDGALWKLRDSRIASLLLNRSSEVSGNAAANAGKISTAIHWFAGNSTGPRVIQISAIALFLAWGVFDQFHFYLSNKADASSLQRAASWNPDDSIVQTRLAKAEIAAGRASDALDALRRAAEINPGNLGLQEAYAKGLIEAGRDAEAYSQYQKLLQRNPNLSAGWLNLGLLANRLGRREEVVDDWQKAADSDPANANAQLYLAEALDQRGESQAAANHYRAYLQIVAANKQEHAGEGQTILSALVKLADADAKAGKSQDAAIGYRSAVANSEKSGNKALQALALAHWADMQEKTGDFGSAMHSYQQALALDAAIQEPRAAAVDWFNYGQFLRRQKQPEKFALASFLRAESLLEDKQGNEAAAIAHARTEVESNLGRKQAQRVRDSLDSTLAEALRLELDAPAVPR